MRGFAAQVEMEVGVVSEYAHDKQRNTEGEHEKRNGHRDDWGRNLAVTRPWLQTPRLKNNKPATSETKREIMHC
jgi:hypothetical protein